MDKNKRNVQNYIEISEKIIVEGGDIKKAEDFLLKAQKFYYTKKAKDLLDILQENKNVSKTSIPHKSDPAPGKQPKASQKEKESSTNDSDGCEHIEDQIEAMRRVKKCKDYYKLLGVDKFASNNEIKRAYKQLALQFHPDKNKAPGAAEAFKKIGTAKSVLTDFEKRMQYDFYTSAAAALSACQNSDSYPRDIWADIGVDGKFFSSSSAHCDGRKQQVKVERSSTRQTVLLVTLLIALVVALYLMNCWLTPDPLYSLSPNSQYRILRHTMKLRVRYYVKDNFYEYQGSIFKLESFIEDEYLANLIQACYQEMTNRDYQFRKAQDSCAQDEYVKTVKNYAPSCTLLKNLEDDYSY